LNIHGISPLLNFNGRTVQVLVGLSSAVWNVDRFTGYWVAGCHCPFPYDI